MQKNLLYKYDRKTFDRIANKLNIDLNIFLTEYKSKIRYNLAVFRPISGLLVSFITISE
ncbi:hypothetical protein APJL_1993 [Actinobacillus pleuropneumoniae serovar 3 str. JL03]|uniref:Uncharacterized protein n=1 Tax=Actinobacillus pleuropneumoniae serotype 3 (strain JL03) TaxID=434271 RepID=B0BTX4_ACTPJ|nr:hypothetical protein APJL_1993 [Actinobacillus pleuropneumoniae serovar 3 str. JL03]